jgi:AraC family transcriptional regulator, regulatory protein of adaptative response / methylated-DNA-[protein]-cysteine methyltransferase
MSNTMSKGQAPTNAVWRVVLARDRRSDGQFVYVALTTSIYCRPSCPARLPQRRNVLVLPTADEAERRGYTACRRCHPAPGSLAPAEKSVKAALEYIEAHLDHSITLRTLSQVAGLSPNHLQGTFTRIVGLSPKAFCDYRRLARLKEYLQRGESVASASYAAGYGSIRSLYEKAHKALGMTPATYGKGGLGEHIRYVTSSVALGRLLLAGTERGVCRVRLGDDDERLLAALIQEFPRATFVSQRTIPQPWRKAISHSEEEDPLLSTLHVRLRRDVFEARLWHSFL